MKDRIPFVSEDDIFSAKEIWRHIRDAGAGKTAAELNKHCKGSVSGLLSRLVEREILRKEWVSDEDGESRLRYFDLNSKVRIGESRGSRKRFPVIDLADVADLTDVELLELIERLKVEAKDT